MSSDDARGSARWVAIREEMLAARAGDRPWYGPRMLIGGSYFGRDDVLRVANAAYALYINDNALYAPRLFPSVVRFEREVVRFLLDLLRAPPGAGGCLTTGGTESLLLAVHAALSAARERRPGTAPNLVVPHAAHPAFDKAAHLMGVECRRVPTSVECRADVAAMRAAVDDDTALLVASAPSYPFGVTDPVEEIAAIATERGVWLHVDACHGGLVLPFARVLGHAAPAFDLAVAGVTSVSVDVHKLGYSNKGVSALLLRDAGLSRHHEYRFDDWPAGPYATSAISGSRSAGGVASAWAVMRYLGVDGYREIAAGILDARARLLAGLGAIDGIEIRGEPDAYLLAFGLRDGDAFAVDELMTSRGWVENRLLDPPSIHLFLDGANAASIDDYLADLRECVAQARREGRVATARGAAYSEIAPPAEP